MQLNNKVSSFYKKNKKIIFLVLRIVISVSLLIFLVLTQFKDIGSAIKTLRVSNKTLLALSFLMHFFGVWITAERWRILLNTQKVQLGIGTLSLTVLIGSFFNNLLPTSIGGDVYRSYDVSKRANIPLEVSASVVLVERFSGIISAAIYAIIALFLGFTTIGEQSVVIPIIIFFVLCFIIAFFIINPSILKLDKFVYRFSFMRKIRNRLSNIYNTLQSFKKFKVVLVKVFIYGFLLQFAVILNYYLASRALGIELGLTAFIFIVPIVLTIAMLPISIGGIGLRENSIVFILVAMGIINEKAALLSLILLAMNLFVGILGGIIYITRPLFEKRSRGKSSPDINYK